ncbi:uncharacterized protein LOC110723618 [Chenopodium quinoa]|uniref:uncharacterized protein LOC110723618 n=1 Tax=Chenopodium quinoa TaxID=63459 RepID=UPI000B783BE4|nr:uncharacterized protein LOC110723618 [Chenopodium quinoa]
MEKKHFESKKELLFESTSLGSTRLRFPCNAPWISNRKIAVHLKDTVKDFAVQEGFAINVEAVDNRRYTVICNSEACGWRLHASRLPDGRTWAIKKIWPSEHMCRGLETYNPICNVKWVANKVMEDIRANPSIPGKSLNELLFQRFGVYLKQATLYRLKNYVISVLFGGHDESYSKLPMYVEVVKHTNPESKAFVAWRQTEYIDKHLLFSSIFISFTGQWKGFLRGCRPLIGVDGTHLKGNYGGILLTAVGLDGNNKIFPIAYAIVGQEDKDSWSFFFWHLLNIVKESSRKHWTIISDRQKGVDLALTQIWPEADRRYCCRHLSRNYKKAFPGPLMYILFWRACNATSFFTFRKAMERLKKGGGDEVMKWFADLGEQSRWTKHKFDPNVCNDSNTSNFVESFNSTLGIDRCRPILTLLEGIRRVCMVRLATRYENGISWKEDDICPKIAKMVKKIGKASSTCKAFKSKPGEYEIHEGRSQFPLSLNQKVCSCGAWQLSGIPCRHAIRALVDTKLDPHAYVSSWFSVKTYRQAYRVGTNPVPDTEQWPESQNERIILPPKMKRGIGRPSWN